VLDDTDVDEAEDALEIIELESAGEPPGDPRPDVPLPHPSPSMVGIRVATLSVFPPHRVRTARRRSM
jgi:hypothetical protein